MWQVLGKMSSQEEPVSSQSAYIPSSSPPSSELTEGEGAAEAVELGKVELVLLRLSGQPALARALLEKLPFTPSGWCQLVTMAPTKSNGYIQLSFEGCNKVVMLQEVVLWAGGSERRGGEQVSHLCCQPSCKTVGHVVSESEALNQRRKGCVPWVKCPHVDSLGGGLQQVDRCLPT